MEVHANINSNIQIFFILPRLSASTNVLERLERKFVCKFSEGVVSSSSELFNMPLKWFAIPGLN
jgi:hypothetical protein